MVRTPYLLALIANQAVMEGRVPEGTAALFTGFVRSAIQREVERENPRFEPGGVLTVGEYRQLVQRVAWRTPYDLPDEGPLEPGLRRLAFEMQLSRPEHGGQGGEVRLPVAAAAGLLNGGQGELVIRAGQDLGVMVEDLATLDVQFGHQLLQEYFAAREVARDAAAGAGAGGLAGRGAAAEPGGDHRRLWRRRTRCRPRPARAGKRR